MPDTKPDPDSIEREPPNWYVLPIALAVMAAIFITYRFACSAA